MSRSAPKSTPGQPGSVQAPRPADTGRSRGPTGSPSTSASAGRRARPLIVKALLASGLIAALVWVAETASRTGLDKAGLERLAETADPTVTGAIGPKQVRSTPGLDRGALQGLASGAASRPRPGAR